MTRKRLTKIGITIIILIGFVEIANMCIWLMNQPSTLLFYLGVVILIADFIGMWVVTSFMFKEKLIQLISNLNKN